MFSGWDLIGLDVMHRLATYTLEIPLTHSSPCLVNVVVFKLSKLKITERLCKLFTDFSCIKTMWQYSVFYIVYCCFGRLLIIFVRLFCFALGSGVNRMYICKGYHVLIVCVISMDIHVIVVRPSVIVWVIVFFQSWLHQCNYSGLDGTLGENIPSFVGCYGYRRVIVEGYFVLICCWQ